MKALVFGLPGSGKTTFANRLSKITGIPVFHIDRHFFQKGGGWIERPLEDFLKDVTRCLEQDAWIMDGNGMKSLEMRFQEAEIAIYCTLPRLQCLFRIFYRWISNLGKEKSDGPEGAVNNISLKLLKYLWSFSSRYTSKIYILKDRYPKTTFIHIRSKKELENILERFSQNFTPIEEKTSDAKRDSS